MFAHQPLMMNMEIISEMLDTNSTQTWLIAQKNIIIYYHCESL
jgi:hypothetical protein